MLCLIACLMFPVVFVPVILSYFPPRDAGALSLLTRPLPRPRPRLRFWAAVVGGLALDYAAARLAIGHPPWLLLRFVAFDTAVVLACAVHLVCFRTDVRDLWGLAFLGGMLLLVSMPPVVAHH